MIDSMQDAQKTYLVAVSGGVDSVVLLDMLARKGSLKLLVAHFDHGIRVDSAEDARFVEQLAKKYNLPFKLGRASLGEDASEDLARKARYDFLRSVADDGAIIVTAHHADDVLETMLINLSRGTGWRGLASLRNTATIARPLLQIRKEQIIAYAKEHGLAWREDSTNQHTHYLRNRIRHTVIPRLGKHAEVILLDLYNRQIELRSEIESIVDDLLKRTKQSDGSFRRYDFIMAEPMIARELLYELLRQETGRASTKERLDKAILAIKTARTGSVFQLGDGVVIHFQQAGFTIT